MMRRWPLFVIGALALACRRSPTVESSEVLVPAGEFLAGANCSPEVGYEAGCDGEPRARQVRSSVRLHAFSIDRNLVTRAQYAECVRQGACVDEVEVPRSYYAPRAARYEASLAQVRHEHAVAYCRWRRGRLPTSDEFERVARGTDGRVKPWGTGLGPCGPHDDGQTVACMTYAGPAGVRAVAFNPQWVAERSDDSTWEHLRYPAGMIRGAGDVAYMGSNDIAGTDTADLYAAFRCARDAEAATNPPLF